MKKSFARFKIQRRFGMEFPGLGKKGALERRPYPPGESGSKRRKYSDYALRLEEKQKIRFHYVLREHQLRRFIRASKKGASSNWGGKTGRAFRKTFGQYCFSFGFGLLVCFQHVNLVSHGHVLVNDKKTSILLMWLKRASKVSVTQKALLNQNVIQAAANPRLDLPDFLTKEEKQGRPVGVIQDITGGGSYSVYF